MKDVNGQIAAWRANRNPVALATVIETWGSSPRGVGAKLALNQEGAMVGSVSGGCVEGAVVEVGQQVLSDGVPQLVHFGVSDETAWEVGLACGGEIDVYVESLVQDHFQFLQEAVEAEKAAASLTVIEGSDEILGSKISARGNHGEETLGSISERLDEAALEALKDGIRRSRSGRVTLTEGNAQAEATVGFVDVMPPPARLVIVGGVHIAVALAEIAQILGHRSVVVDPRRSFGSQERFPGVDALVQAWPQEALPDLDLDTMTAVAVLTHDPKIDDPALIEALASPAYYVGALGSRRTQEKRRRRLLAAGVSQEQLGRLHGPIGLDIGAQTPEEIALAVMAEILQARRRGE